MSLSTVSEKNRCFFLQKFHFLLTLLYLSERLLDDNLTTPLQYYICNDESRSLKSTSVL